MIRSKNQIEQSEIESIKNLIAPTEFNSISESLSNNKIYSKNHNVIVIRKNNCTWIGDVWEK